MPKQIPDFDKMWAAYPHGGAEEVKRAIGGAVDADYITNTCVIRVSRAINEAGGGIPVTMELGRGIKLLTVRGGDGKRYALRVREFRRYMELTHGRPTASWRNPRPERPQAGVAHRSIALADIPAALKGKRGIIMFEVEGWGDAGGHFDLWNGSNVAHEEYFYNSVSVSLWTENTVR
jgi:Type VI secretion system (T6SS), amidase effector protein 4